MPDSVALVTGCSSGFGYLLAEPLARAERRTVGVGYTLYVALDDSGKPRAVPPLLSETDADRARDAAALARQAARLTRRKEALKG